MATVSIAGYYNSATVLSKTIFDRLQGLHFTQSRNAYHEYAIQWLTRIRILLRLSLQHLFVLANGELLDFEIAM